MRILTYNVNGIRSAIRKGFLEWLATDPADVICLQEIKASEGDVDVAAIHEIGYKAYFFSAQKKGYSGTAILTKALPTAVFHGDGRHESDAEGRLLRVDFGNVSVFSVYFPNGGSGAVRQAFKYKWLEEFLEGMCALQSSGRQLIICGDYNIAHREIDIHNPKSNAETSGFLPEERAWMDRFFASGFADGFRSKNPDPHHYSWWSFRAGARGNNKGWRIDYISVSESLKDQIHHAEILPDVVHSDHCPVRLELDF